MGKSIPSYAILSHKWENEEVSYKDMIGDRSLIEHKAGFRKISKAAEVAHSRKHTFIWVDACCIDKRSSAELTEAINSMYQWYKSSKECLAYLADVATDSTLKDAKALRSSRWFTRGWTLQELIAPSGLMFLSREWVCIGIRSDFANNISQRTGIPVAVLEDNDFNHQIGVSRKRWHGSPIVKHQS